MIAPSGVELAVELVVVEPELVVGPAEGVDFAGQVSLHFVELLVLFGDGLDALADVFDLFLQLFPGLELLVLESEVLRAQRLVNL